VSVSGSGSGSVSGSGSETAPPAVTVIRPTPNRNSAWLMVGGTLAFVTAGAVLAYSASSSEQDLKDLYVGLDGVPPTYDAKTAQRYQDLIDEGHRYQYLSWASFGIAGACALGATILFARAHGEVGSVAVRPIAAPHEAG